MCHQNSIPSRPIWTCVFSAAKTYEPVNPAGVVDGVEICLSDKVMHADCSGVNQEGNLFFVMCHDQADCVRVRQSRREDATDRVLPKLDDVHFSVAMQNACLRTAQSLSICKKQMLHSPCRSRSKSVQLLLLCCPIQFRSINMSLSFPPGVFLVSEPR